jgi:hypothetical protein
MATGIVAIAASPTEPRPARRGPLRDHCVAYVVLAVLLAIAMVRYWSNFAADVTNHAKGFAFLTTVAATNVLASASIVIHGWWDLAWACGGSASRSGRCFVYTTLIAVVIRPRQTRPAGRHQRQLVPAHRVHPVHRRRRRSCSSPAPTATPSRSPASPRSLLGIVLYLIVMTMVFLRWTFHPLDPTEADPPAWIAAGAVAITVLAGSNILLGRRPGTPDRSARTRSSKGSS